MQQLRAERLQNFSVVITPRTCAHCGKNFGALRHAYLWAACKQPKQTHRLGGPQLSSRETQVVALIRQAKTNKEIAYELCLSEGTVKEYLNRIYKKLQVRNRTELALRGLDPAITLVS